MNSTAYTRRGYPLIHRGSYTLDSTPPGINQGFRTRLIQILVQLSVLIMISATFAASPVQAPVKLRQIKYTGTSWFASPIIHHLGTASPKLIGCFYDVIVWDSAFNELDRAPHGSSYPHKGRIYAPAVCADLEGDGIYEVVVGSTQGSVAAYEWKSNQLVLKAGWPASACDAGQCPEVRGMAAGDLDQNGTIEVVVTTTQTNGGAQVFVFNPDGSSYQPPGLSFTAWPRYNTQTGYGNDADANGMGNHGYGCFGLNVGIGDLDDDPEMEIVVTFDNHQINVFHHNGMSMLASNYFTNPSSLYPSYPLNWGQFIRWFDPMVEHNHFHLHQPPWPSPEDKKWLQWTESPPGVADLNRDGKNEVVCVTNVEKFIPYATQHHSVMALEGGYGDGSRSARRLSGWENLPSSGAPQSRAGHTWYPPTNPPSPAILDIDGDRRLEIIYAAHDGYLYCYDHQGNQQWRYDFTHARDLMYASGVTVADLNRDRKLELVFTTFGDPESLAPGLDHGYLVILDAHGNMLHDIKLPQQGTNGNGKGAPAAPTIGDLTQDGNLEIIVQTFGAGLFVYTVPGSSSRNIPWPTGRGNYLRDGRAFSLGRTGLNPVRMLLLGDPE